MDVYRTHKRTLDVGGKNIRLTIPAGVRDGQEIRIKGHGGAGVNGGPPGDLMITFSINNNTSFRREKANLFKTQHIDLYTALLGGEIHVDTLDGRVKLTVPPGTQNGTKVKLKGKGFPKYKREDDKGDLVITYHVDIPTHLSAKERSLLVELRILQTS